MLILMSVDKKDILVIEDHESLRVLLGHFLGKNYEVTTKSDGFDALAWLSYGNIPDLIILDMSLPRLSGLDFLENIRSSGFFQDIPVIIVSGEEDRNVIAKCQQLSIDGFLHKPFNPIVLKEKISAVLQPALTQ